MSNDILKNEEEKVERLLEILRLTPENTTFRETAGGFAAVTVNGVDHGHVNIIRTFPLSDENSFLSIRLPDGKQEEVGMIEDINDFDGKTRELLEKQLKIRYYRPLILSIENIKEEYGHTYWTVVTDKGPTKFASSSGSASAVIRHKKGVIIKDSNDNRYEIEDLSKLSPKEMKKIDLYL